MTFTHFNIVLTSSSKGLVSQLGSSGEMFLFYSMTNTHLNSLLVTNLSPNVGPCVDVDGTKEIGQTTQDTAVPNCFCILSEYIARAEIGDNA